MNAVIYTRVSTSSQADKHSSIPAQISQLEAYAASKGMVIVGTYEDPAYTGRNFDRPGYKRMISEARSKNVQAVLVYSLSRFGRNTIGVLEQVNELKAMGVQFHALDVGVDTGTPMGTAFLAIVAALAQLESDQISKRIVDVQKDRKTRKKSYCGNPPLGFRNQDGELVQVESEMAIVSMIFDMHRKEISYSKIARELNRNGYKGKSGAPFQPMTISKVINNNIYESLFKTERSGTAASSPHTGEAS